MKFSRTCWQDIVDIAAWVFAAFLVLALVNALRGSARSAMPPTPQLVQQPHPMPQEVATTGRSAQVSRTRRD